MRSGCGSWIRTPRTPRPRGRSPIARARRLVHADGEKPLELLAPLIEDAERGVAGSGELARRVEHALEHRLEIEIFDQASAEFQ
jgi:hypothetical protein